MACPALYNNGHELSLTDGCSYELLERQVYVAVNARVQTCTLARGGSTTFPMGIVMCRHSPTGRSAVTDPAVVFRDSH